MPGASPLTIERVNHTSEPDCGFFDSIPLPLSSWTLDAGTIIPAAGSGNVGRETTDTNHRVIRFDDTADTSDIIRLDTCLPDTFKIQNNGGQGENAQPRLVLSVKCRVTDIANAGAGGATANTDLALVCQAYWHRDDATAISVLATVITTTIGATDYIAGAEQGFIWRDIDITGAMSAAQLAALDGSESISILLYPNEAPGTDLVIDVLATKLKFLRHASLRDSTIRV